MFQLHTLPTTKNNAWVRHTHWWTHISTATTSLPFHHTSLHCCLHQSFPAPPSKQTLTYSFSRPRWNQLWLRHKAVWSVGGTDMYAVVFTSKIRFLWSINLCPLPHKKIFTKFNLKWEHSLIWHKFFHDGWQKERPGGCLRTVDRCESANKHGSTHQPMQAAKTSQQQTEQGGKSQHW